MPAVGTVTVRVPEHVYKRLSQYAVKYQVPLGQAVEMMIAEYEQRIAELEEKVKSKKARKQPQKKQQKKK